MSGSTGKFILHTYCTSMLWSINSCQNRVSAGQYHLTVSRAQVSTYRGRVFFEVILDNKLLVFKWSRAQVYFFQNSWNMLCSCAAQLKFWFQTDLGRENSASHYRQGRQLILTFLTMVTRWSRSTSNFYALIGQNSTGEFMRKIYAASWNCLLDTWSWQSFVSTCDVFNCLFLLDIQNEIQLIKSLLLFMANLFIGFLV